MRAMKISIIIPAYNAEKQIRKCVLSALQQDISHNEYEIIVINDGSTDQTADIIQELSKEYPTIKSITTINQGVSAARKSRYGYRSRKNYIICRC